jgi:hypothetical protein
LPDERHVKVRVDVEGTEDQSDRDAADRRRAALDELAP